MRPIDFLTGEIAVEVTGVVGVSPALWYFRYIASIFLTLHKRLWTDYTKIRHDFSSRGVVHEFSKMAVSLKLILDYFVGYTL